MATLSVGVTPVKLPLAGTATPVIQNLGAGIVYFDTDPEVSTSTGLKLAVNALYEFPRDLNLGEGGAVYLVSSEAGTDVRYVVVG
jgi:hypothetical protein